MDKQSNSGQANHLAIGLSMGITIGAIIGAITGEMASPIILGSSIGLLAAILVPALLQGRRA